MQRWWDLSWHHYRGVRFWGYCSPVKQWICLRDYPEPGYGEEVGMSYRVVFTDLRMLVWECSKSISGGSTHKLIMVRCHEKESGWWLSEVAGRSVRMKRVLILNCNQWDVVRDFAESSVSAVQGAGAELEAVWNGAGEVVSLRANASSSFGEHRGWNENIGVVVGKMYRKEKSPCTGFYMRGEQQKAIWLLSNKNWGSWKQFRNWGFTDRRPPEIPGFVPGLWLLAVQCSFSSAE